MDKFNAILELIKEWTGDNYEDGELDGLVMEIIELFDAKTN